MIGTIVHSQTALLRLGFVVWEGRDSLILANEKTLTLWKSKEVACRMAWLCEKEATQHAGKGASIQYLMNRAETWVAQLELPRKA
jgi:hypothetical protein